MIKIIKYQINRTKFPKLQPSQVLELPSELKYEFTLDNDDYRSLRVESGVLTYMRLLINLIFLKPGTYPNSPNMGINIQQYKFELMDQETIMDIESHIREQISTYLPNNVDYSINIELIEPDVNAFQKILGIGFAINSGHDQEFNFFLFMKNHNGKTESRIVVP